MNHPFRNVSKTIFFLLMAAASVALADQVTLRILRVGLCGTDASEYHHGPVLTPLTTRHPEQATYAVALAYTGPTWAVLQSVTPPQMRAMAAAILLFLVNLIGLGMGPQLIGIMSDVLHAGAATTGLRLAIEIVCSASMLASVFFYLASRSLVQDLAADVR